MRCKKAPYTHFDDFLHRFGTSDPDWIAIVFFIRNLLTKLSIYTDDKKGEIQKEVTAELMKKDFSQEHLEYVVAMLDMFVMQTIGTLELEESLTREKRSASQLLNEMSEIIASITGSSERQHRKLDAFKERTVGIIQSGEDQSVIIAKVRSMFRELILEFKEEAAELQERALMLEKTANFDPLLTELHNRRAFDAFLQNAVETQTPDSPPLGLMMIDVDNFKLVNDTYGHLVGDDVLHALSRIITAHAVQYKGFAARYGGEELVIITQDIPQNIVTLHAEALRKAVEQYDFRIRTNGQVSNSSLKFTVSIGVSMWHHGQDAGQIIRAADEAMYVAKNNGRNQVYSANS